MAFIIDPNAPPVSRIPVRVPPKPEEQHRHQRTTSAPSKLQRLRADYQRKLFVEKELRMADHYMNMEEHLIQRTTSGKTVREFLAENRNKDPWYNNRMIDYNSARLARNFKKPPVHVKNSMGRDRAKPLEPIQKTSARTPPSSGRGQVPIAGNAQHNNTNNSLSKHQPLPPKNDKPKYTRTLRRNSRGTPTSEDSSPDIMPPNNKPLAMVKISSNQKRPADSDPINNDTGKLTNFQKWQLEQNKAREERLAKFSLGQSGRKKQEAVKWDQNNNSANSRHLVGRTGHTRTRSENLPPVINRKAQGKKASPQKSLHDKRAKVLQAQNHQEYSEDFESADEEIETERENTSTSERGSPMVWCATPKSTREEVEKALIQQKELEIMAVIEKQRAELARIQQENEKEAEQERQEAIQAQKRLAAQKERRNSLQQAEDMMAAREQGTNSRRSSNPLPSPKSRVTPSPRNINPLPSPKSKTNPSPRRPPPSPKSKVPSSLPPATKKSEAKPKSKPAFTKVQDSAPIIRDSNVDFYLNKAEKEGALENIALASCSICGRKFAQDRLDKHMKVCAKASSKKRKVFDPVKMRNEGTDFAKFTSRAPSPAKKKKNNWRSKHEEFIRNLRYAKQVTAAEASGGDMSKLPPPPPSENPDYVKCPHCERRFNETAAERHIPRCNSIKAKPKTLKKGARAR